MYVCVDVCVLVLCVIVHVCVRACMGMYNLVYVCIVHDCVSVSLPVSLYMCCNCTGASGSCSLWNRYTGDLKPTHEMIQKFVQVHAVQIRW